jgi:hypothetical protein
VRHAWIVATAALIAAVGLSGWLLAAEARGTVPRGNYQPAREVEVTLTGSDAEARRRELVRSATPRHLSPDSLELQPLPSLPAGHPLTADLPSCRFVAEAPTGTSAKFACVLDGGEVVKVKYGRNPEIHAEAAASRLLTVLGYPADFVTILPRIRCYGCPRFPFTTMRLLSRVLAIGLLSPHGYDAGYTDFEWASVERKFPAPSIQTDTTEGWAWWELERSRASRSELDALRLLAVFLAHWDNKSENQRLVCMETTAVATDCARPVLVVQDVGATFGPSKLNRARWRELPIWADSATCAVSMRTLPSHGATFPDGRISEEGRALLAARLSLLSDADIHHILTDARVAAYESGTDDAGDLAAWTEAFRYRVDRIVNSGPCPAVSSDGIADQG